MRYEDPEEVKRVLGTLTLEQLWAVVKIAKHVRLRARNNTAFNNYMNRLFPYARFATVQKQHSDGTTYPGLQIKIGEAEVFEEDE